MTEKFKTRVAVFVGLRNNKGEILLQQRANTGFMDGYYDFSCSGHLEDGESIRESAIRELHEEIGVEANEEDLKLIHVNQNNLDIPYLNFTFMLDKWRGEPRICEPEKCSDLQFFALDDIPEKSTLNVRVNQQDNFSDEMLYSYIDPSNYQQITGEAYAGQLNGKI